MPMKNIKPLMASIMSKQIKHQLRRISKFQNEQKQRYIKIREIEKELGNGDFTRLDYFIKNTTDNGIDYALEWISYFGRHDLAKKIISTEIDITGSIIKSIITAVNQNHCEMTELLLETYIKMKLAHKSNQYNTIITKTFDLALKTAVENNNYSLAKLLVDYGANISQNNNFLVILAARTNNLDIIRLLTADKVDQNALSIAIECAKHENNIDILQYLNSLQ